MKKPRFIPAQFLAVLGESLQSISEEVLYSDERGFQGALLHELNARLGHGVLPDDPVIQQEYQKRLRRHGITIRSDIIVHIPFERGLVQARDEGNFVAIELKRKATAKRARDAFRNLAQMKRALKYPLTVFVNVDSEETHAELCPRRIADQTVCFSVRLDNGKPVLRRRGHARLTRKENPVFILSTLTPEAARCASDQRMRASGGIDWHWIQCARSQQMIYHREFGIILVRAHRFSLRYGRAIDYRNLVELW